MILKSVNKIKNKNNINKKIWIKIIKNETYKKILLDFNRWQYNYFELKIFPSTNYKYNFLLLNLNFICKNLLKF